MWGTPGQRSRSVSLCLWAGGLCKQNGRSLQTHGCVCAQGLGMGMLSNSLQTQESLSFPVLPSKGCSRPRQASWVKTSLQLEVPRCQRRSRGPAAGDGSQLPPPGPQGGRSSCQVFAKALGAARRVKGKRKAMFSSSSKCSTNLFVRYSLPSASVDTGSRTFLQVPKSTGAQGPQRKWHGDCVQATHILLCTLNHL